MTTSRNPQSQVTTDTYDGLGRRIRKETAGVVREYVYSGDHLILEVDGQGRDLAEYVYYPGVDAPHSMRRRDAAGTWRTYYYLTEAPGHVVGLIDETGQVVKEYAYTPFGEITETTPAGVAAVENPLTYTAREWDAEVGLYFYRARYYDPALQRFISEDPIGLAGGLNPYTYVGNDPINFSDPSGLARCVRSAYLDITGGNEDQLTATGVWFWDCGNAWSADGRGSWRSDRGAAMMVSLLQGGMHGALNALGAIPGPGEVADGFNALLYAVEGDGSNAILSAASMLPGLGLGATFFRSGKSIGGIALDNNALIPLLERSEAEAAVVLQAMGGRAPYVSTTVVKEFLRGGGSKVALRQFLRARGGGVLKAASSGMVDALQQVGLKPADARAVGSAIEAGMGFLTRDKRILNKGILGVWKF